MSKLSWVNFFGEGNFFKEKPVACAVNSFLESAKRLSSYSENYLDHLEKCWSINSSSKAEQENEFFLALAHAKNVSVKEIKHLLASGLDSALSSLKKIIAEIEDQDSDSTIEKCVEGFSLIVSFSIAYEELMPPRMLKVWSSISDEATEVLTSLNAMEEYSSSFRSIDTPILGASRYNLDMVLPRCLP